MPKTLFLYNQLDRDPKFFELEGDCTRFKEIYINEYFDVEEDDPDGAAKQAHHSSLCAELCDMLYDPATGDIRDNIKLLDEPTKDWTWFVRCGFIP